MTDKTVARGGVARPADGIEGVEVPPAAFDDRSAFIDAARTGLSGEVVKQAIDVFGHRELIVRLVGTTSGNLPPRVPPARRSDRRSPKCFSIRCASSLAPRRHSGAATGRASGWMQRCRPWAASVRSTCATPSRGRRLVQDAIHRIEHGEFP